MKDGSLFCNKCGNRISKAAQPVQPEDDRTVGIIYPDQNNPVQSEYIAPEPVIKDAAPEPLGIEPEPSGILAEQQEPAYSDGFPVLDQAVNETAAPQTPVYDAGNNMYQQGGWQNTPEPYYDQQPQQPQVSPAPGFYGQARQPNMNIPGQQDIPGPAAYAAAPRNEKAAVRNRKLQLQQ